MELEKRGIYEFGEFQLDLAQKQLRREGKPVPLTPKVFDTLAVLVERSGELIAKEDLMNAVWKDIFVEEKNLTLCIHTLRKALGQETDKTTYIETVPKRGYRFNASVKLIPTNGVSSPSTVPPPGPTDFADLSTATKLVESKSSEISVSKQTIFSKRSWLLFVAGVAVLALGCLLVYVWLTHKPTNTADYPLGINTIAVLPFTDIGEKNSGDFLAEGLPDAMITTLSHIKQLKVRPTSAVSQYFGKKIDSLVAGRELNVDAVIEGTIRRDGDDVRVVVRLLRVSDGEQLWSETFTEKLNNVLALENAISLRAARELAFTLAQAKNEHFVKRPTTNADAYNAYLKARTLWSKNLRDQTGEVIALYQQAISLDPNFAFAYAGLAEAELGQTRRETNPTLAEEHAQKAIALDNTLAEAHTTLAHISTMYRWDWAKAENEHKRALELNPNYARGRYEYSLFLVIKRRFAEAEEEMKKALAFDPFSPFYNEGLCGLYYYARRYDEAIAQCSKTQVLGPKFWHTPKEMCLIYEQKKSYKEYAALVLGEIPPNEQTNHPLAQEQTEAAIKRWWQKLIEEQLKLPEKKRSIYTLASRYALLGETEKALTWIEYGCRNRIYDFARVNADPVFDELRSHPRFIKAMQSIGL